jgi:hypothetical protein
MSSLHASAGLISSFASFFGSRHTYAGDGVRIFPIRKVTKVASLQLYATKLMDNNDEGKMAGRTAKGSHPCPVLVRGDEHWPVVSAAANLPDLPIN